LERDASCRADATRAFAMSAEEASSRRRSAELLRAAIDALELDP
jgi:hypothetical protein